MLEILVQGEHYINARIGLNDIIVGHMTNTSMMGDVTYSWLVTITRPNGFIGEKLRWAFEFPEADAEDAHEALFNGLGHYLSWLQEEAELIEGVLG